MAPIEEDSKQATRYAGGPMLPIEKEVARGLRFTHLMQQAMHRQANETVRLIEGLSKLLVAKGITSDAEWVEKRDHSTRIPEDSPSHQK